MNEMIKKSLTLPESDRFKFLAYSYLKHVSSIEYFTISQTADFFIFFKSEKLKVEIIIEEKESKHSEMKLCYLLLNINNTVLIEIKKFATHSFDLSLCYDKSTPDDTLSEIREKINILNSSLLFDYYKLSVDFSGKWKLMPIDVKLNEIPNKFNFGPVNSIYLKDYNTDQEIGNFEHYSINGPMGSGKTHLAYSLVKQSSRKGMVLEINEMKKYTPRVLENLKNFLLSVGEIILIIECQSISFSNPFSHFVSRIAVFMPIILIDGTNRDNPYCTPLTTELIKRDELFFHSLDYFSNLYNLILPPEITISLKELYALSGKNVQKEIENFATDNFKEINF